MLTEKQIADGWKPHDGGPCPQLGALVIMYRSGDTESLAFAEAEDWSHEPNDPNGDIIAYREADNGR